MKAPLASVSNTKLRADDNIAVLGYGGRTVNIAIPAAVSPTVGSSVTIPSSGQRAYLLVATAAVNMRVDSNDFSSYVAGTGITQEILFNRVEIQNVSAFPVVVSLWIGYASFIDNRLILATTSNPSVVFPTFPTPGANGPININDLSGQQFVDINGVSWFATQRIAIIVGNTNTGSTNLFVQKASATASTGPSIAVCFPGTSLNLPISGNYRVTNGAATAVDGVVSEIYEAIATS